MKAIWEQHHSLPWNWHCWPYCLATWTTFHFTMSNSSKESSTNGFLVLKFQSNLRLILWKETCVLMKEWAYCQRFEVRKLGGRSVKRIRVRKIESILIYSIITRSVPHQLELEVDLQHKILPTWCSCFSRSTFHTHFHLLVPSHKQKSNRKKSLFSRD